MFFNKKSYSSRESGNVFFFIVLGIVLFGALSYTVVNTSNSGSTSLLTENQNKISQAEIDSFTADMRAGSTQLKLEGCSTIDYTPPAEQGGGDKSCHLFHPDGGGVSYRNLGLGVGCPLRELSIGEACNGLVYGGESSGYRIYTTITDTGIMTWNNGILVDSPTTATSTTDGYANTDALISLQDAGAPYVAANYCKSLGVKWYLPATTELSTLYTYRNEIGNFDLSGVAPEGLYWTSREVTGNHARHIQFDTGSTSFATQKRFTRNVRCIRRD